MRGLRSFWMVVAMVMGSWLWGLADAQEDLQTLEPLKRLDPPTCGGDDLLDDLRTQGIFGGAAGGGGGGGCEGWNACPCEADCQNQTVAECKQET